MNRDITIFNTLSREIEVFKPLDQGKVKLYTCGITVYSTPHIGNWIPYIYWDVLRRMLMAEGYEVNHAQNITDVGHLTNDGELGDRGQDKMLEAARKENLDEWQISERITKITIDEAEALNLLKPTHLVKATSMIEAQIEFVKGLEEKGFTYLIEGEGVYFDTAKFKHYGDLAKLDIEGLQAGARVADVGKRNITDFVVWKLILAGEKRAMAWDSPWGEGFPGWHLECSVIAREILGDQIDIHTGGIDHIPIHHTNEIAQTESLTGKKFVNYWLHNNHIKILDTKMSKSLGNVFTLDDIDKQFPNNSKSFNRMAYKLLILNSHYQSEGNFTWEILQAAVNRLKSWSRLADYSQQVSEVAGAATEIDSIREAMLQALRDNLSTGRAIDVIEIEINRLITLVESGDEVVNKIQIEQVLNLLDELLGIKFEITGINLVARAILTKRKQARDQKDWVASDDLRDSLSDLGIGVRDAKSGQLWYHE